jgi:signal transduction histidine kinase
MNRLLAPQKIITLSVLMLFITLFLCSYLATSTPWMGIKLAHGPQCDGLCVVDVDKNGPLVGLIAVGDQVIAISDHELTLQQSDLMEEPDAYSLYEDYNAFFTRQNELYAAISQPAMALHLADGRVVQFVPHPNRPIRSLPFLFWYQLACGAIVFLAGMGILVFRPREQITIFYALTGLGLMLASSSAAIYSTRELALEGGLFYSLSLLNQFGTLLFAGPFISILWYYPQRIHRFPLGPVVIGIYMVCWLFNLFQLHSSLDVVMRYPIFIGLAINLSLAMMQWKLSTNQPLQRAILKWFLLAWLSGTTLYIGLYTAPLVLHMDTIISQSLGWGILVTVYMGIALGITRYRLFELDRWVVTGWLWFLGGIVILFFDVLLVSLLDIHDHLSLAISLGIAGWLYFPVRQYIWTRLSWNRKQIDYREMLPTILNTLLNSRLNDLHLEWRRVLQSLYSPLHIESVQQMPERVELNSEGVSLTMPGIHGLAGLQLSYADRGSRLFNNDDRRFAEAIYQLFSHVQNFREAFSQGVQKERQRLARDLHDDVGARLLTLVYSAADERQGELARDTLGELRAVIQDLESEHHSIETTLSELRVETVERCQYHDVKLQWGKGGTSSEYPLSARQHANIKRIVREAITNALRHSDATKLIVDITIEAGKLIIEISNNNVHIVETNQSNPGRGMRNIESRAIELGGSAEWKIGRDSILGGYTVKIEIPLQEGVIEDE